MYRVYEPDGGSCARVRRDVLGFLTVLALPADVVDSVVLVANELVGNAVDHASTPFRLVLTLIGDRLLVDVTDGSTAPPRLQPLDTRAARGRGLQMVEYLSSSWTFRVEAGGKTVTAEVPIRACA